MSTTKPLVVVTGPNKGGYIAWLFIAMGVRLSGGKPIRMTPNRFDTVKHFDAVIIGGGSDIHPTNRTEAPLPDVKHSLITRIKEALLYPLETLNRFSSEGYDKDRDEMEIKFIDHALAVDKPVLGICRGHQLLNAALGGTMYTSTLPLLADKPRIRSPFPRKEVVYAKPDTLLEDIIGDDPVKVNAIHSQAVAKPGDNLEVSAKEQANIVQAIERTDNHKVLGVQWHPEYLFYLQAQRNIFNWLIKAAKS